MSRQQFEPVARAAAAKFGIDPDLFVAQIQQESGFNPNARSPVGASGIAQIMPATAQSWGVNPSDPVAALNAAAKNMAGYYNTYLKQGKDAGTAYSMALAAYNAGPGNVNKYGGIPPFAETQNYVKRIMGSQAGGSATAPVPFTNNQISSVPPVNVPINYDPVVLGEQFGVNLNGPNPFLGPQQPDQDMMALAQQLSQQTPQPPSFAPYNSRSDEIGLALQGLTGAKSPTRAPEPPAAPNFFEGLANNFRSVYDPKAIPTGGLEGVLGQGVGVAAPAVGGGLLGLLGGPFAPITVPLGAGLGGAAGEMFRGHSQDVRDGKQTSLPQNLIRGAVGATAALPMLRGATLGGTVLKNALLSGAVGAAGDAAEQVVDTGKVDVGRALQSGGVGAVLGGVTAGLFGKAPKTAPVATKGLVKSAAKDIPLLPESKITNPARLLAGDIEPSKAPTLTPEQKLLTGDVKVKTPGEFPGVLEIPNRDGSVRTTRLPEDGGVLLKDLGKTESSVVIPNELKKVVPNLGVDEALPTNITSQGVLEKVVPTNRAQSVVNRLKLSEFLDGEEIKISGTGKESTITATPKQYDPAIQPQIDQLRAQYKTLAQDISADPQQLYKQFDLQKRTLIQGDSLSPVEGGLTQKELNKVLKQRSKEPILQRSLEDLTSNINPNLDSNPITDSKNVSTVMPEAAGSIFDKPPPKGFQNIGTLKDYLTKYPDAGEINSSPYSVKYGAKDYTVNRAQNIDTLNQAIEHNIANPTQPMMVDAGYMANIKGRTSNQNVAQYDVQSFTPKRFVQGKYGLAVEGVNSNKKPVTLYLDAHTQAKSGLVGDVNLREPGSGSFEIDTTQTRAQAIKSEDLRQVGERVQQLEQLLPNSKAVKRLSKMLKSGNNNYSDITSELGRMSASGELEELMKQIEPKTGGC